MIYSKAIFTALILSVSTTQAYANMSVRNDLQRCASQALNDEHGESYKYRVSTGSNSKRKLDHDVSPATSTFRMKVSNKSTGTDLGTVACQIDSSGKILAAFFE